MSDLLWYQVLKWKCISNRVCGNVSQAVLHKINLELTNVLAAAVNTHKSHAHILSAAQQCSGSHVKQGIVWAMLTYKLKCRPLKYRKYGRAAVSWFFCFFCYVQIQLFRSIFNKMAKIQKILFMLLICDILKLKLKFCSIQCWPACSKRNEMMKYEIKGMK